MPRLGVALAAWLVMGTASRGFISHSWEREPDLSRCLQALMDGTAEWHTGGNTL